MYCIVVKRGVSDKLVMEFDTNPISSQNIIFSGK